MIPPQRATMSPALEILRNESHHAKNLVDMLAVRFGLTDEERDRRTDSGGYVFDKRVRFALYDLKQAGLLVLEKGRYSVTEAGRRVLDGKQDLAPIISQSRQKRSREEGAAGERGRKAGKKKGAARGRKRTAGGGAKLDSTSEKSPIPSIQEIAPQIMKMLRDGGSVRAKDLTGELAERFALTDEARNRRYPSGRRMFYNLVSWALYNLKHAGLLDLKGGEYSMTEGGRNIARQNPGMDAGSLAAVVKRLEKGASFGEVIGSLKDRKGNVTPGRDRDPGAGEERTIPHHKELMPQVLEICRGGKGLRIKDLKEKLAARLGLTQMESDQKLPSGHNLLYHRAYLAALYLVRSNLLDCRNHLYSITDSGKAILDRNYDQEIGRFSGDLADQILDMYRKGTGRRGTRRQKGPAGRRKRQKGRGTSRPRPKSPDRKGIPSPQGDPRTEPVGTRPKSSDRKGIPETEDRLNEFKEFYQYDADIERLPVDMLAGARESAVKAIKRRVQARFAVAVCAFGNADGGTIYLGVKSDGTVSGLEKGRELGGFDNYVDDFANNIETRLEDLIKDEVFVIRNVKIDFMTVDGRTICRVRVGPSTVPLYLHADREQQFWVRGAAPRSKKLVGMAQIRYIKEHFDRSIP